MIKFIVLEFSSSRVLSSINSYSGGTTDRPTGFLEEVVPDGAFLYETDPTDTNVINMLGAYQAINNPAQLIYLYDRYYFADTPDDVTGNLKSPHSWMLETNYFYHTTNPPVVEQEADPLLNHATVRLVRSSVAQPTAPSGVVFTGMGVDGWGSEAANLDGWSRPSTPPTPTGSEILWYAETQITLSGSTFTLSPFLISPVIPAQTIRYSADGTSWHATQVTADVWYSIRFTDGSWGPRELIDPVGHIELLTEGVEIGSRTGTLSAGQHIVLNHTDWSTVNEFRIIRRQYEDANGLAAGNFLTTATPWFPAQAISIIDAQAVRSTRTPYFTNAAFLSSQWGSRIIAGHAGEITTGGSVDCIMSFTLANVTLGTNIAAHVDIAGISNSRTAITSVEIK